MDLKKGVSKYYLVIDAILFTQKYNYYKTKNRT